VKERYITATGYGQKVIVDKRGRTVRFIPSKLADNPHVNPEYATDLPALDGKLRAAFLNGNWDVFAGQMFTELSRDRHVVAPFKLPADWRRLVGVDWGSPATGRSSGPPSTRTAASGSTARSTRPASASPTSRARSSAPRPKTRPSRSTTPTTRCGRSAATRNRSRTSTPGTASG
jgi:hypothetical protein